MPASVPSPGARPPINVVANRLPVSWSDADGWTNAPGGLVTALDAFVRRCPVAWFGSQTTLGTSGGPMPMWEHGPLHSVATEPDVVAGAVNGVANSTLWPALHGLRDRVRWRDDWWESYVQFNGRFAAAVADWAAPGGLVWVHDYHLMLVPLLLMRDRPDLAVGLSIHTPFDAASLSALPCADELAEALTAPSTVGVQTAGDLIELEQFVADRGGGQVHGLLSPVSVDPEALVALSREPATVALAERLRAAVGRRQLIVGIDRLDYTKSLPERLQAIDLAFRRGFIRPDDIEIVQIAQPTRAQLEAYRDVRLRVERIAHDVGSHWLRSDGTTPLQLVTESRSRREVAALLGAADVVLVTPRRDGMNLVAKEFSVLNEERAGVLVLSRGTGAADRLGDGSVLVDGDDVNSIANGIATAVGADVEVRRTWATNRAGSVRAWTAHDWATSFCRAVAEQSDVLSDSVSECLARQQTART